MSSPNRDALIRVATGLGPLADELVFVGGHVPELVITDPGATRVRPTDDVDAISAVMGRSEYHRLAEQLRGLGFVEDTTPGAPICRWRLGSDLVDVMPAEGEIMGFRNRWYDLGIRTSQRYELSADLIIRIVTAPVFLATKWEAFVDRGAGDWYGSHDIEDIVAVVAGRRELYQEISAADLDLRNYVAEKTRGFLASGAAQDVIAGALPDARLLPGLVPEVRNRFEAIAKLGPSG